MIENKYFFRSYDLASASAFIYGRCGGPQGYPAQGKHGIQTTGSSTSITAAVATVYPFAPVNVGDELTIFTPPEVRYTRWVATKVDDQNITVDTAIDLSTATAAWYFTPFRKGSTASDGWHEVSAYRAMTLYFDIPTLVASGGVDYSVEGLIQGSNPIALTDPRTGDALQGTFDKAGTYTMEIESVIHKLRVGLKAHTASAGTDSISVWVSGDLRHGRR